MHRTARSLLYKSLPTRNFPTYISPVFRSLHRIPAAGRFPSPPIPPPSLGKGWGSARGLATGDHSAAVDEINLKFAEAREEIEAALESKETVYFDEEAECARTAVKDVLDLFDGLLGRLPDNERAALQRSMGLKIEQLKAELKQLDE